MKPYPKKKDETRKSRKIERKTVWAFNKAQSSSRTKKEKNG